MVENYLKQGRFKEAREESSYCRADKILSDLFKKYLPEKACERCGKEIPNAIWGNLKWYGDDCDCIGQDMRSGLIKNAQKIMEHRGVPGRYRDAKLEDFDKKIQRIASEKGAYLYGPCGTGKTHLLAAIMRERIINHKIEKSISEYNGLSMFLEPETNGFPMFISIPELLLEIRATFKEKNSGNGEKEIIGYYAKCPTLMIDDIGTEKPTEWAMQTLYLLIDRRYREDRATFFTSNLTLGELSDRFSDRISSRIAGMCKVVKMEGKDRRINAK